MYSFLSIKGGIKFGFSDGRKMALPFIRRDYRKERLAYRIKKNWRHGSFSYCWKESS
jgi:hypothetical protein